MMNILDEYFNTSGMILFSRKMWYFGSCTKNNILYTTLYDSSSKLLVPANKEKKYLFLFYMLCSVIF